MKYAVKEYAATAVDIIARRLRVSFLNVQAAEESLPVIVQIMGDELGWDKKERERQTEEAITFLRMQMGKDVNKASQDNIPVSLTKAEIAEYVKRFNALDDGKKGYISINDIRKSLKVCPDKDITRPGVENVKPKGWFKYSLQRDKGVVLDCSTMSLSTWETYIWSNLH